MGMGMVESRAVEEGRSRVEEGSSSTSCVTVAAGARTFAVTVTKTVACSSGPAVGAVSARVAEGVSSKPASPIPAKIELVSWVVLAKGQAEGNVPGVQKPSFARLFSFGWITTRRRLSPPEVGKKEGAIAMRGRGSVEVLVGRKLLRP